MDPKQHRVPTLGNFPSGPGPWPWPERAPAGPAPAAPGPAAPTPALRWSGPWPPHQTSANPRFLETFWHLPLGVGILAHTMVAEILGMLESVGSLRILEVFRNCRNSQTSRVAFSWNVAFVVLLKCPSRPWSCELCGFSRLFGTVAFSDSFLDASSKK